MLFSFFLAPLEPQIPAVLEKEILSILGDVPTSPTLFSNPIQPNIAERWSHVLASGLDEEACKQLGNKYPTPENCRLIKPPSINQEVRMALSESVLRRDARLASLQQQVAASLSAIGLALTHMLKESGGGATRPTLSYSVMRGVYWPMYIIPSLSLDGS